MTPKPTSEAVPPGGRPPTSEARRHSILSINPPVTVSEGELLPAVLTIDLGAKIHFAVPLGAFTMVREKPCFVVTLDVVGLAAASLGIGVGALAVWKAPEIIRAIGEAEARRRET